ncbi:MAG: DUF1249 domain-containing protein [Gammaproteobacteria bacterium]|jgi:uncharacterized protein YqiB (DUF1249 family)|nr:MAG: DUF1249 domain-containing protein [Gammaproteobacteria bacterium]
MIADSLLRLPRAARPGSFAALMSLYESNYVRLGWLLPDPRRFFGHLSSRVPDDLLLHIQLLERSRYTTTVRMTYFFEDDGERVADPDLKIRIYHDALLAEAMECTRRHRHTALKSFDTRPGGELSRRWARNVMLNKWLEYCSEKGHRFVSSSAPELSELAR